jgi:membrane protein implicated in regulation of membrane protease activity
MQIRLDFFDLLLFAVMVSAFVIGIHQSFYHGVIASYWLFMISMLAFLWLNKRLKQKKTEADEPKATEERNRGKKRK